MRCECIAEEGILHGVQVLHFKVVEGLCVVVALEEHIDV